MNQLLDYDSATGEPHFQKPADVSTASKTPDGHSITGVVVSYNAKNPVTYELYELGGDGEYGTTPAYEGIAIAGADTTTAGTEQLWFDIKGIPSGTYKLVIKKTSHLDYTITGIVITNSDVELTTKTWSNVSKSVDDGAGKIVMAAGDVTGDGKITVDDKGFVTNSNIYGRRTDAIDAALVVADINGDGLITVDDKGIVTNSSTYGKNADHYIFTMDE
jgi:uncharacterized protein (DUF2141 family)